MIAKTKLDTIRGMADEFRQLTEHGNFDHFAVVNRYSQLSAQLSLLVPALVDEIERLRGGSEPAAPERPLKMDLGRAGLA